MKSFPYLAERKGSLAEIWDRAEPPDLTPTDLRRVLVVVSDEPLPRLEDRRQRLVLKVAYLRHLRLDGDVCVCVSFFGRQPTYLIYKWCFGLFKSAIQYC